MYESPKSLSAHVRNLRTDFVIFIVVLIVSVQVRPEPVNFSGRLRR